MNWSVFLNIADIYGERVGNEERLGSSKSAVVTLVQRRQWICPIGGMVLKR